MDSMSSMDFFDSELDAKGRQEAQVLRDNPARPTEVDVVIASSLRRALQTAHIAFGDLVTTKGILLSDLFCEYKGSAANTRPSLESPVQTSPAQHGPG